MCNHYGQIHKKKICVKKRLIVQMLKVTQLPNVKQNIEIPGVWLKTAPNFINMKSKSSVNVFKHFYKINPHSLHCMPKQEDT